MCEKELSRMLQEHLVSNELVLFGSFANECPPHGHFGLEHEGVVYHYAFMRSEQELEITPVKRNETGGRDYLQPVSLKIPPRAKISMSWNFTGSLDSVKIPTREEFMLLTRAHESYYEQ